MTTLRTAIKKHSLLTYFTFAFTFSWGAILIAVGRDGLPVREDQLVPLIIAMLLGPSVAGLLTIGLESGREGFRQLVSRLVRWRVRSRWYAVALLVAPLSTVAVLLGLSLVSRPFQPALFTAEEKTSLIMMWLVAGLMVGFFEELGWTGFAVPKARENHGVLATGLIVGLLWGAWHFLVNWEADTFSGIVPLALLLARLFSWLPPFRVLMVWLYERTESLPVVMLMHVSLVATTGIIDPVLAGKDLLIFLVVKASLLWAMVAVVVVASGGSHEIVGSDKGGQHKFRSPSFAAES